MKKITLNSQRPKLPTFIFALLLVGLMTACQKESIHEMQSQKEIQVQKEKQAPELMVPTTVNKMHLALKRPSSKSATSRSATSLEYHDTLSLNENSWYSLIYLKDQLPDSTIWKVEVEVVPLSGDPDLQIYGYDWQAVQPSRYIRSSQYGGMMIDKTSFRGSDLKLDEDDLSISLYGFTDTQFEIFIYFTIVDCIEFPVAEPIVTLEYVPVCGCDGQEYPNASAAFASGVTDWTEGACHSIDGSWVNIDSNTLGITKMIISDNSQTIHLYGACSPSDCDWEEETLSFDGKCYIAKYEHGFATRSIKIHKELNGQLRMDIESDFHDNRDDQMEVYYFTEQESI